MQNVYLPQPSLGVISAASLKDDGQLWCRVAEKSWRRGAYGVVNNY